jgi:hypothetical protein
VTTDKSSYADGDMITVSGSTQMYIPDTQITVKIISPIGNIVKIAQVNVGLDKNYSTTFIGSRGLWQEVGTYHVIVQFGTKNRVAETTFQFTGSSDSARNTMLVEGTNFSVKYSITNGKVMGIKLDPQAKSLIISIQTTGDGILILSLPRELIDAKINGNDTTFYVLVDGQEGNFQETATTTSGRILSVNFTNGTTEIEIIGTFVIPEFGLMESTVFTIAVISIIAISSTMRLRLASKL